MQWTGLNELREKYLSFFESKYRNGEKEIRAGIF